MKWGQQVFPVSNYEDVQNCQKKKKKKKNFSTLDIDQKHRKTEIFIY